jgi:DNA-binding transcriptional LysR family regulator
LGKSDLSVPRSTERECGIGRTNTAGLPAQDRVRFPQREIPADERWGVAHRNHREIPLPLWTAMPWSRNGTLVRVLPAHRMNEMHIRVLYVSREYLDAKIRSWVGFLRQFIPQALENDELSSSALAP